LKLAFDGQGWDDDLSWQAHDAKLLKRVNELLRDCRRSPFSGFGKPEQLRGTMAGWWSRRINQEHRLVYRVSDEFLFILQCRFHYADK
jgi:toxin YoeB